MGLLGICLLFSLGNALASPSLTSLASKITHEHHQGKALGIMQGGASLARAIGPAIGGVLLTNAANTMDGSTLYRTFFTAAAIMFVAFLIAVYSVRLIGNRVVIT
jgi:MFS family permease